MTMSNEERFICSLEDSLYTARKRAESAEARAEAAERERDFLAHTLTHEELCPAMFGVYMHGSSCKWCKPHKAQTMTACWLEWARQQARGGGNE